MILHAVRGGKAADDPILRIENISKNYGSVQALCGVTTAIRRGAIHGLLGENGAGKSTLVGIIRAGRADLRADIYGWSPSRTC